MFSNNLTNISTTMAKVNYKPFNMRKILRIVQYLIVKKHINLQFKM